eukprot:GFKZ01013154.1.p1 GENE.GFKZ01013154.1~~GFKZ01013154.1.p1  ORF type:complete len:140 (+),score=7.30 GFKZ01013154.1:403-822(+)
MPTSFLHSYSTFVRPFRLFNTMDARPTFVSASSGAPLRASFRFNLYGNETWPLRRWFSLPLERGTAVSCAGPPRKPEELLHGRLPCFEGASVKVAHKFVRGDELWDNVELVREEERDSLASELVEHTRIFISLWPHEVR